ncbi:hypothetical protein L6R49_22665 [Myxococcota bacterium]|nr:hypothetical protein [Myxococcota bacterium]
MMPYDLIQTRFEPQHNKVVAFGWKEDFVVQAILCSFWRSGILKAVRAVLNRTSFDLDDSGFTYPNAEYLGWDDDVDGPLWEGVCAHVMSDEAFIPEPTFARLMLRVAQTFIAGANEHDHPMLREPWWPELLDATRRLEAMVAALDDGGAAER